MLRKLIRLIITFIGIAIGYGVFLLTRFLVGFSERLSVIEITEMQQLIAAVVISIIFGLIFFKISPLLVRQGAKASEKIEKDLQSISTNDLVAGTIGLVAGLVVAFLVSRIYEGIQIFFLDVILTLITYIILSYLGVVIATKKGRDIIPAWLAARKAGAGAPKAKGKQGDSTPKIFDTSVIIDGRIADIMKTGFIEGSIVIPEFVLIELQHIADSSDSLKRNRGRRGLDILNKIQTEYGIDIYNTATDKSLDEIPEVDVKLLKLAQNINGKVVTNDFNLNKVAAIKGVEVLNINELANTLKPVVLPGEDMTLFLVKEGKENNQAVAYLDDGTMIVVEEGRKSIGQTVKVTVTSVLQTAAGRMIFAKLQ